MLLKVLALAKKRKIEIIIKVEDKNSFNKKNKVKSKFWSQFLKKKMLEI